MNEKNLDIEALRGIAIAITFVAHLGELIPAWYGWTGFFWLGGGVDLFFAISGFVIVSRLACVVPHERDFRSFAFRFWTRRIFRLWPAAVFWSTLVLLVSETMPLESVLRSRSDVFYSWLFGILNAENFYINFCSNYLTPACAPTPLWHYWSLSLEEQFYLLVPCLLFFTRGRAFLIPVFLITAIAQGLAYRPWDSILWFIRTDALLYGCAIALTWHHYGTRMAQIVCSGSVPAARAVLLISLLALVVTARQEWVPLYMGAVALCAGMSIAIVSGNRNLLTGSDWTKSIASYVGSRSYSIYLVHNPVLSLTRHVVNSTGLTNLELDLQRTLAVLIALTATLGLSEASYRLIEMPLRRFGRNLTDNTAPAIARA